MFKDIIKVNIAFKLAFWILLAIFMSSAAISQLSYENGKVQLKHEIAEKLSIMASDRAESLEAYLNRKIEDARLLSMRPTVIAAAGNLDRALSLKGPSSAEYAAADKQIRPVLDYYRNVERFYNLFLVSPDGTVVFSLNNPEKYVGANLRTSSYRDASLGKVFDLASNLLEAEVSDFEYDTKTRMPAAFIAAPIISSDNMLGIAILQVNSSEICAMIGENRGLGETGEIVVADQVGDKAVFVMPTRHDPYAAFKRTVDMGANPDLPIVQALRGQEDYSTYTDYRGKEVLASWQYLPSYGWGLVAKIDIQEAFAPVVRLRNSIFLVTALIMLLSVSAASLIARSISEPIDRLCKGTEIIGSGNLDYKVDIDSSDEIGHLSRAFNNMASHLKHTTTSLDNINREIAEREKSEASVRRLAAIVESSDDAIIGKDLDGIITSWNKGAERLYGYTEKEIVGKQIFTIVPDDHRDELIMLTQKIRENQPVEHFETVRQKKDGTRFEASLSISPIKDSEGKVIGASTIARDISGRKKLEKLLQKYNEELEVKVEERTRALKDAQDKLVRSEKLAVVGQLASSVAHELRNPLGVIKNVVYYLNMLDLVKESPEVKDNLNIIVQEIENSDKIITDLLEFSHSKKPVFLPEDINLIVKEILDRMRISPGIELVLDLKDGLPEIEVDALQIHQVLYNITKNALEAMENGGRLTIKTALVDSDAFVGVSISDTGPAISKENRPKIFEPLFSTKTKGTGLGLSVCSSIVEHHGGSIEVISEAERETTFTVKLPVKRA